MDTPNGYKRLVKRQRAQALLLQTSSTRTLLDMLYDILSKEDMAEMIVDNWDENDVDDFMKDYMED